MASLSAVGGVLAQRNARIFYAGSVACWTGSWMQRVATDWLAWELTNGWDIVPGERSGDVKIVKK